MIRPILAAAAGAAVLATAVAAQESEVYREDFNAPRPQEAMFGGVLALGADGAWTGSTAGDRYTLANSADPNAVRYIYINSTAGADEATLAQSRIAVTVDGTFAGEASAAGLIYRFDEAAGTYYAFSIGANGAYGVWERGPDGLRSVASGTHSAIVAGANRLDVYAEGDTAAFDVNGERVMSLSTNATVGGGVGLFAVSTGSFSYDDFSIFSADATAPASTGGK